MQIRDDIHHIPVYKNNKNNNSVINENRAKAKQKIEQEELEQKEIEKEKESREQKAKQHHEELTKIQDGVNNLISKIDKHLDFLQAIYNDMFFEYNEQKLKDEKILVDKITTDLMLCGKCIASLESYITNAKTKADKLIVTNIKVFLGTSYSDRLKKMRNLMQKREHDVDKESDDTLNKKNVSKELDSNEVIYDDTLTQELDQERDQDQANRHKQIVQLSKDIVAINQMYKDLNNVIYEHGTMLDRIETNILTADEKVEKGLGDIIVAEDHYKSSNSIKNKLVAGLGTVIVGLSVVLGLKLSH